MWPYALTNDVWSSALDVPLQRVRFESDFFKNGKYEENKSSFMVNLVLSLRLDCISSIYSFVDHTLANTQEWFSSLLCLLPETWRTPPHCSWHCSARQVSKRPVLRPLSSRSDPAAEQAPAHGLQYPLRSAHCRHYAAFPWCSLEGKERKNVLLSTEIQQTTWGTAMNANWKRQTVLSMKIYLNSFRTQLFQFLYD